MEIAFSLIFITFLGMGSVFFVITLLWLLINTAVHIFSPKVKPSENGKLQQKNLRRKAAIAAVTVALAREEELSLHEFPLPPTATVSAWQAVMRANTIKKRGQVR